MKLLDKKKHIKILFEDNHLLIVRKPSPLLTQPTSMEEDSLELLLKNYIKLKKNKQGEVFLHCIHRLDKNVSGIVIFAKTSKALTRMQKMQKEKKIKKKYLAVLHGELLEKENVLTHYLVHKDFKAVVSNKEDKNAKCAKLSYQVIESLDGFTLVEITLETGRYHQIRAQFSKIGHPIVGDEKYGSPLKKDSIALQHTLVDFMHPVALKQITIKEIRSFDLGLNFEQFDKHLKQPL